MIAGMFLLLLVTGTMLRFMVAATGFANNMRSMITGWYELDPQGARGSIRGEVLVAGPGRYTNPSGLGDEVQLR